MQNQVSLSAKPEGAELLLSYRTRTPFELEQALWFCLGAAGVRPNLPLWLLR